MFCSGCGKEIPDDAVICIGCGRAVKPVKAPEEKWTTGVMVALVIGSILIPLIGIISGVIGLTKDVNKNQGAILLTIGILMTVAYIATL